MQFESSAEVNASPEKIFNIYSQVNQWSIWDPDTNSAVLNGDFSANTVIDLQTQSGSRVKIKLLEVVKNHSFITESKLPLCVIQFEHTLKPLENQTIVTHKISFSGILGSVFSFLLASQMKKSLSQTLLALKKYAEV